MVTYPPLHEQIRAAMTARGVSVTELSKGIGHFSHSALSRILAGTHGARPDLLNRIARALDVTLVRHEVYSPSGRNGDENCHSQDKHVTKSVTCSNPTEAHGKRAHTAESAGSAVTKSVTTRHHTLAGALKAKGLSPRDVGLAILGPDAQSQTVYRAGLRLLSGETAPSWDRIVAMASALGVEIAVSPDGSVSIHDSDVRRP